MLRLLFMLSIAITNNKNTCLYFLKQRDSNSARNAYQMSPHAFQINLLQKPKIPNVNWTNESNLKEVLF